MNNDQLDSLAKKRKHLQMRLKAKAYIHSGIKYHWLDYYNNIKTLDLQCNIEWLCSSTTEEQPYFADEIVTLNHPDLKPDMVKVTEESLLDKICNDFPSTSHFKYVMDLPLLNENSNNTKATLLIAAKKLNIKDGAVYFLSTDCCPLLQLQWSELVEHSNKLFNHSPISLIFTDVNYSWIIFRSIENEWRCGFTKVKS